MASQCNVRRDRRGWSVFDRWTGQIVRLQGVEQSGLTWVEAGELVERLHRRRLGGDGSLLQ